MNIHRQMKKWESGVERTWRGDRENEKTDGENGKREGERRGDNPSILIEITPDYLSRGILLGIAIKRKSLIFGN